ncbi:DoxX family protein [Streptomyces sp. NPDC006879]|uniref:DoxX family protein n=1 Tax=Streptomyces sp. NPDC006879 TaxID=3364767 RepID=UPI0036A644E6
MDVLVLIGRILFCLIFLGSAANHLAHTEAMAGYAASRGLPAAKPATLLSGLLMLVGSLMVVLGVWGDIGALLLAAFVFTTALVMHAFWRESDPQAKQLETVHFMKDVSLGGGALILFVLFAYACHDLGLTLTGPALSIG